MVESTSKYYKGAMVEGIFFSYHAPTLTSEYQHLKLSRLMIFYTGGTTIYMEFSEQVYFLILSHVQCLTWSFFSLQTYFIPIRRELKLIPNTPINGGKKPLKSTTRFILHYISNNYKNKNKNREEWKRIDLQKY